MNDTLKETAVWLFAALVGFMIVASVVISLVGGSC
jgi:hypothetical protein